MALPPTRTLAIVAVTAVVSLGAGLGLSHFIISPAEAAADAAPPEAGPITVPVEMRELSNDVVMRGDAIYENPVAVTIETGDIGGPAVVTGQVPAQGSTIDAGSVILEITGRPVILLTGDLPVYRTLRAGVSGPDVTQLKAALAALGIDPGDAGSDVYDAATSRAVAALYQRVGYPAPSAGDDAAASVTSAQQGVRAAQDQLAAAQRDLATARAGITQPELVRLQAAVNTAQARYDEAVAACTADPDTCLQSDVVAAKGDLDAAKADLVAGTAPRDTTAERSAVTAAQESLSQAQALLGQAQLGTLTPLPAGEVVYLAATPRRVDEVTVARGAIVSGTAVMTVSGATLQIEGKVPNSDAELLAEGTPVEIALPDGTPVAGTVQTLGGESTQPGSGQGSGTDSTRTRVVVVPGELTEDQRLMLQGANVRITIPVGSTDGAVLAVPAAALTAGPGGEARVEVVDGDSTTLVTVTTGLAADGYVEVSSPSLHEGDLVVVGTTGTGTGTDESGSPDSGSSDEPTTDESSAKG